MKVRKIVTSLALTLSLCISSSMPVFAQDSSTNSSSASTNSSSASLNDRLLGEPLKLNKVGDKAIIAQNGDEIIEIEVVYENVQ